jgi:hypothetical protein
MDSQQLELCRHVELLLVDEIVTSK